MIHGETHSYSKGEVLKPELINKNYQHHGLDICD